MDQQTAPTMGMTTYVSLAYTPYVVLYAFLVIMVLAAGPFHLLHLLRLFLVKESQHNGRVVVLLLLFAEESAAQLLHPIVCAAMDGAPGDVAESVLLLRKDAENSYGLMAPYSAEVRTVLPASECTSFNLRLQLGAGAEQDCTK